jgi:hypothetical protein
MASKKMKKLGKVAALLGAAYAASKMGSDNTMDGTEGVFPSSESTKPSMLDKIKKGVKDYATKDYVIKSPDRNPNLPTKDTANFSFLGGAKTGTFVTVKTKMGKNKKTRIC